MFSSVFDRSVLLFALHAILFEVGSEAAFLSSEERWEFPHKETCFPGLKQVYESRIRWDVWVNIVEYFPFLYPMSYTMGALYTLESENLAGFRLFTW